MKQSGESLEMQNKCAEIKIRAERRAGELLIDMQGKGEVYTKDSGGPDGVSHDVTPIHTPLTLEEAGFDNYMEAHRCKSLADMPEEAFEGHIQGRGRLTSPSRYDV